MELLLMIAWREIAIRYKQSVMGFLWALLLPALIIMAGLIVRAGISRITDTPLTTDAMTSIMVKSLPWAFFVSAIRLTTSSLTANINLVTRASCPRIVFPLAAVLSALFDLAVAAVPLMVALAIAGIPLTMQLLWVVPLLLLLTILVTGLGIALATANLFYRDVKYIVEAFLMFGIFLTPVLFDVDMLGPWRTWMMLNPLSPLLEGLRTAVVGGRAPDLLWIGYSAMIALAVLLGALFLFHRGEPVFADRI